MSPTPETDTPGRGWHALLQHWGRDLQLLLFVCVTLQLFRLLLIAIFQEQLAPQSGPLQLLEVVGTGLRYDLAIAASWISPTFLLAIPATFFARDSLLPRVRHIMAGLFATVGIVIIAANIIFFYEYGDQFNQHIFGIAHDDTVAILITIWKSYHPILFLSAVIPLSLLTLWSLRRWLTHTPEWLQRLRPHLHKPHFRATSLLALLLLFSAALRGGTLWGEPIRLKHAFVVDDIFLNRTVLNPFSALRYTIKEKLAIESGSALERFWPDGNLVTALNTVRSQRNLQPFDGDALSAGLLDTVKRRSEQRPEQIFLILMESHSGWTVMPSYREFGFSPRLAKLAERGVYFPNFLASSGGTIGSMNALITGLPDAGLNINYETSALTPYPSSLAETLRRLGYTTRFFYGGFLSWQRLDTFAMNQGFDEVYGGGNMSADAATNEWGVDDAILFDFVFEKVDPDRPSFNFILTTSNHQPYDRDLERIGFPIKSLPASLRATKEDTLKVLGHLWYADQQAGHFVERAEEHFNSTLFAVTGDHTARQAIQFPGNSIVEQVAVPLILYGPGLLPNGGLNPTPGSHIDLVPTLIELAAPHGYAYSRYGRNLLGGAEAAGTLALGHRYLIGEQFITTNNEARQSYPLNNDHLSLPPDTGKIKAQQHYYNALRALSWQQIKRGDLIADEAKKLAAQ